MVIIGSEVVLAFRPDLRSASEDQCGRRPATGCNGDELIFRVRESALVVRLEWIALRLDEPRPVGFLGRPEEPHSPGVGGVVGGQPTGLVEGDEARPRCVCRLQLRSCGFDHLVERLRSKKSLRFTHVYVTF